MKLSANFEKALVFATQLHAEQTRKGTSVPYIAHLLAVTSIVLEAGGNSDEAIAALLHDAIEDQKIMPEKICQLFGDTVAAIVVGCTNIGSSLEISWKARKEATLTSIHTASPSVCLVLLADKLHNARTLLSNYRLMGDSIWVHFNGGKEGTLWYYSSLVETFRAVLALPLVDELNCVVSELLSLADTNRQI